MICDSTAMICDLKVTLDQKKKNQFSLTYVRVITIEITCYHLGYVIFKHGEPLFFKTNLHKKAKCKLLLSQIIIRSKSECKNIVNMHCTFFTLSIRERQEH